MKNLLFVLCLVSLSSWAAEYENYRIKLDWDKDSTLEDNVTQMCDDTYYPAVEIVVPGKAGRDFAVEMDVDITSGKAVLGCTVKKKETGSSVTYTFDAQGSCTVRVRQLKFKPGQKLKQAVYELSDAC